MNNNTAEKLIVIRPEDLNHHGNLFGGRMMAWADELAYIAASLAYRKANFVTRHFEQFNFTHPATTGDIVLIQASVVSTGTSSCRIQVGAQNLTRNTEAFNTFAVMVHIQDGHKAPIPR